MLAYQEFNNYYQNNLSMDKLLTKKVYNLD